MMHVRLATSQDHDIIRKLTRKAFFDVYRPGCSEHLIVDKLRLDAIYVPQLEYVLERHGNIIAHIIYAVASIKHRDGSLIDTLIFGPISVNPLYQKQGYGSALIIHTLRVAKNLGYKFIAITGNPSYYQRFGFLPALQYDVNYGDMDKSTDQSFFMIKILDESFKDDIVGTFIEPTIYHVDDTELAAYESKYKW